MYAFPHRHFLPPPPVPINTDPNVPALPQDRYQLAYNEMEVGAVKRISQSPLLDDTRAHKHERTYGLPPPSPRNLHERGTAASNGKSVKVRCTNTSRSMIYPGAQGRDKDDAKRRFFHGAGHREEFRVSSKTPLPKNAALNKKLMKEVMHSVIVAASTPDGMISHLCSLMAKPAVLTT